MEYRIIAAAPFTELDRVYLIQATLKSFKGRRDVAVYLFRTDTNEEELSQLQGLDLVDTAKADTPEGATPEDALRSVLEAFTAEEGNEVLDYLKARYEEQISEVVVSPIEIPVPLGMVPFSAIPEGKTMGFIRFDAVADYNLPFVVHGFYDLDAHDSIMTEV